MQNIKNYGQRIFLEPLVGLLVKYHVSPNVVTFSSLVFAILAFLFYRGGTFWAGAIFIFLCGIVDTFDGAIARRTGRVTHLGGFLDSTIDRIDEFIIYLGLFCYYYSREPYVLFWILFAILGSFMVSYTRARAEGFGISPRVGIFERFTRFFALIVGSFLGPRIMVYVLVILAIGTFITTIQRIIFVRIQLAKHE
jgi:CDP-diacylglycerol--glycerol-3-phosphate 3-phosphatidyltransferase